MLTKTLDDTTLTDLVADATTAPSMHNAQPWQFRYERSSRTLTLRADLDRAMPEADPSTRGLHVGCGAALLNLRVSAAHLGLDSVTTLLPEPSDPPLLAVVRLGIHPDSPGSRRTKHSRLSTPRFGAGIPAAIRSTSGRSPRTFVRASPTRPVSRAQTSPS